MTEIYLDNSATTRIRPEALERVGHALSVAYGNPSSLHRKGLEAERLLREARREVAATLGVDEAEIVFTSGGTEANNLAILGSVPVRVRRGRHLVATRIEHSSILRPLEELGRTGWEVEFLPVDGEGRLDPEVLASRLRQDTVFVSIGFVNNEIGTVQPVAELSKIVRERSPHAVVHVDAVQGLGKLRLEPRAWDVDLVSLSGHKIHAPKGVGALYVRRGLPIVPLLRGGEQEGDRRAGTENVAGAYAFEIAAALAQTEMNEAAPRLRELRRRLLAGIEAAVPEVLLNGLRDEGAAPHILNVSVPGIRGETIVHALEARGVYASTGSACASRRPRLSHVIAAIGGGVPRTEGAVRFSLSAFTTGAEVDEAVEAFAAAVSELRPFARAGR